MRTFDVQSIEIDASFDDAFRYIADRGTLPQWTQAYAATVNGISAPGLISAVRVVVGARLENEAVERHRATPRDVNAYAISELALQNDSSV
jgi:hypothetical protein